MDPKTLENSANFSILEHYGTNITNEKYITNPAIGRDEEIKKLILVLLTPEKSAILIGKPGIGKTAVVEGLAFRLQRNDVPEALKGYHIVNLKTASLLGTMPNGESKVQRMIDELKTKEKIILFIDEIHMLIGATDTSAVDFANIFKEGLGRGSIKVIGATTTEEYERYILRDKAFTRRFQKIDIPEPSEAEVVKIMMGTLPKFEAQTGRKMKYTNFLKERIMTFIVSITSEYKRVYALGSRYPDVSLTLLKQAFSYTVYDNREYVNILDVRKAIENSKNIYPDVIKKELVNFDIEFKDLILEENGEKAIEEWRKDDIAIQEKEEVVQNIQPNIEESPVVKEEPKNIKKATVGKIEFSYGFNEVLNSFDNSKKIDEELFSTGIDTIIDNRGVVPTEFYVTDEITKGGADNFLFGGVNDLNYVESKTPQEEVYRVAKPRGVYKKEEGENMTKRERMDIKDLNFDKYHNFFQNDNQSSGGYDEATGRNPVDDFVAGYGGNLPNDNYYNPGYQDEYQEGYDNQYDQGAYYPDPYGNNQSYTDQGYDQGYADPYQGAGYDPYNQNYQVGYNDPYLQPPYYPGPYNQGYQQPSNTQSFLNPMNNQQPQTETLFGAPMSGVNMTVQPQPNFDNLVTNSMRIKSGKIVDEFPTFEKLQNLKNITNSVIGDVQSGVKENNMFMESNNRGVFDNSGEQPNNSQPFNPFGVPNQPTVQDFNQFSPSPQQVTQPNQFMMPTPVQNSFSIQPPNQPINPMPINNFLPTNDSVNMPVNNSFLPNEPESKQNFIPGLNPSIQQNLNQANSFPNINMGNNTAAQNDSNKKWKFIDNTEPTPSQNNTSFSSLPVANNNNNQQPEGQFLDFGELNKGKIKQEESSKYITVAEEVKPTADLTIEGNQKEEKYFDDFFE